MCPWCVRVYEWGVYVRTYWRLSIIEFDARLAASVSFINVPIFTRKWWNVAQRKLKRLDWAGPGAPFALLLYKSRVYGSRKELLLLLLQAHSVITSNLERIVKNNKVIKRIKRSQCVCAAAKVPILIPDSSFSNVSHETFWRKLGNACHANL